MNTELIIASIALIVSIVAIIVSLSIHKDNKLFQETIRKLAVIETAKVDIERNTARINGLMSGLIISKDTVMSEDVNRALEEAAKLNAENRDRYTAIKHHFSQSSRSIIDSKIDSNESLFPKFQNRTITSEEILGTFELSDLIKKELDKEISLLQ